MDRVLLETWKRRARAIFAGFWPIIAFAGICRIIFAGGVYFVKVPRQACRAGNSKNFPGGETDVLGLEKIVEAL
ncbi:MAG: hypothetical protein IIC13_01865 [SAR324 cluster bacterium]|nr:hypothetical protein [SAR324 cluster bacterium]